MELRTILEKINFVHRYQNICKKYNDFDNGMRGNQRKMYDTVIKKFDYSIKYYNKEKFYRLEHKLSENLMLGIQLSLKDGLVESMLDVYESNDFLTPDGRFDFIAEELNENYNRDKYNLPSFTSEKELEEILKEMFSIFEDLKDELSKQENIT